VVGAGTRAGRSGPDVSAMICAVTTAMMMKDHRDYDTKLFMIKSRMGAVYRCYRCD
jgi:hypothetical protein